MLALLVACAIGRVALQTCTFLPTSELSGRWLPRRLAGRLDPRRQRRSPRVTATAASEQQQDEQRPPWDAVRALRTAAFYGAVPNPLDLLRPGDGEAVVVGPGETLWSPENPRKLVWGILDDVIMGGASESFLDGNVWKGDIITAGGGFVGIRTQAFRPAFDVSGCQGIRIRVRGGDGQRFKLIVRDSYDWNGIAWSYEFDTGSWNPFSDGSTEVLAPFSEFVPTVFAKRVPDVNFNAAKLTTLQLTLSRFGYDGDLNPNFKAGPFSVTLESFDTF